ncbi:septum site-determining protein MinC [Fulvimarina sp. 2208YS6-2-32]|uniref:Probable septum site-determining protein MinC n=1 Tax=Fulvimarina uroteuthidis TaxID=3098149 RepID=A0ABU5HZS7_9HYPH|nr:septum site-determining protein MinC [Fulvimarina sp. 2208YS6-2-32]MDY8108634.1 septum site-determining protein MinC [Fulvimarina sp. 2208YS6-2-32]
MSETPSDKRPIRLKGRSFLAIQLSPELPFENWLARLDDLARRSTGFFLGRPIVLDVEGLDITQEQLKDLIGELGERSVRIMGIEGARHSLLGIGMPPAMQGGRPAADIDPAAAVGRPDAAPAGTNDGKADETSGGTPAVAEKTRPQPAPLVSDQSTQLPSIVIDRPVRSGQSIIFPEGDVTIVGSVSSGAEVVAGGSIHIYGTLRGRALAGSVGNTNARIFCSKLEAELVAIDGLYKMPDDLDAGLVGQAVTIWLDGETIRADKI